MLLVEEKEVVLGINEKRYWEKSKAEKYIMKWIDKNPLRGDTGETGEAVDSIFVDGVEDE